MQIGRKDVVWNFAATFMRLASGIIVLPIVLRLMPSQEVGLWNIFLTVGSFAALLDFGFSNSFSRSATYIFSGVKELKSTGYVSVDEEDKSIDYSLLKSVIQTMRVYYGILALAFILIFIIGSPFYLKSILTNYSGEKLTVWWSWFLYGILVAYQLYTYYYSSLLIGRGYIKKLQQIIIIGQVCRIITIVVLLLLNYGLISLVIGQLVSDVVNRTMSYKAFYDKDIKILLKNSVAVPVKSIMKIMTPNSLKIGLTIIRGFLINHATMLIAPLFLSLSTIGEFGTTRQFIEIIAGIGMILYNTFYPKMTNLLVNNDIANLKRLWIKCNLFMILVFIVGGIALLFFAPPVFNFIHIKTHLLIQSSVALFLLVAFLEVNSGMSTSFLTIKNEIPFFKANIISGIFSFLLVLVFFNFTKLGVLSIILGQGLSQLVYQNWKWPLEVKRFLSIKLSDYYYTMISEYRLLIKNR